MRPRSRRSRSAGATVRATTAASRMTRVLVSASGRSRRPVSPPNANTGTNASVAITSDVRIAGAKAPAAATSRAAAPRLRVPGALRRARFSSPRWHASSATNSASTANPSAMAMPPRLITVTGNARKAHGREREQHDQGQRQQRHQRAAAMKQEDQDHQRHHRDLLGDGTHQRLLDTRRQLRAVIANTELHARRKLGLHTFDDLAHLRQKAVQIRVALRQDHAADGHAFTVDIGHPVWHRRQDAHRRQPSQTPRRRTLLRRSGVSAVSVAARDDDRGGELRGRGRRAYQRTARTLATTSENARCAPSSCWGVACATTSRVSAERRHLSHPWDRGELRTQYLVLIAPHPEQ